MQDQLRATRSPDAHVKFFTSVVVTSPTKKHDRFIYHVPDFDCENSMKLTQKNLEPAVL